MCILPISSTMSVFHTLMNQLEVNSRSYMSFYAHFVAYLAFSMIMMSSQMLNAKN